MCYNYKSELTSYIPTLYNLFKYYQFYYDDSVNKKNGEFDVVLQRKSGFDFYEVKYYQSPMKLSEMKQEERQIRDVHGINVSEIGFISINGFETVDSNYQRLTGANIYCDPIS